MTTDLKDVLKDLNDKIAEVYNLDLAEEMTNIYIDLTDRIDVMSRNYWKLVKALAKTEKERDEYYKKLKIEEMKSKSKSKSLKVYIDTIKETLEEERGIKDRLKKEKDQVEYDRDYYQNELDKEHVSK